MHFIQRISDWICKFFFGFCVCLQFWLQVPILGESLVPFPGVCLRKWLLLTLKKHIFTTEFGFFFNYFWQGGGCLEFFVWVGFLVFSGEVLPGKSVIDRCRIYSERKVWSEDYYTALFLFLRALVAANVGSLTWG